MKIICKKSHDEYLIDSGASISIIPKQQGDKKDPWQILKAANGTAIPTYGTTEKDIVLSKNLTIKHEFTIADVTTPILGADFMAKNKIWLNMHKQEIMHEDTGTVVKGIGANSCIYNIEQIINDKTKAILKKVPNAIFKPGEIRPEPHKNAPFLEIKTTGPLPQYRPRRLAPKPLRLAKEYFEDLLKRGLVSESSAPCSSPLHVIPKGNNELRFVADYRFLNRKSKTQSCNYSMPYISDMTAQMYGMQVFSKIDLKSAFEHLPIHPDDIDKTTVCTPFGSFKFHFGNYGLKNAGQTFQLFIDRVLRGLVRTENGTKHKIVHFAYIDDILIASQDEEAHEKDLIALLERLAEYNLKINLKKCEFFKEELEFLGHIFSKKGIKPTKAKVQAILNYKRPKTLGGLKRFLGIVNFYHKFVQNAAGIMKPLNKALRGYQKKFRHKVIDWSQDNLQEAFEKTKNALAEETMLAYPRESAEIALYCDASKEHISGALMQQDQFGHYEPLGFFSKTLNNREILGSTFFKEVTAIYKSLRKFHEILQGVKFTIYTDNKAIIKAVEQLSKTHTSIESRMLCYISTFDAPVKHISGNKNVVADLLSRPNLQASSIYVDEVITRQEFINEQTKCPEIQAIKRNDHNFSIEPKIIDGILCDTMHKLYRPIVPQSLRQKVFKQIHNLAHPGKRRTLDLIRTRYIWPQMAKQVKNWVTNCINCQRTKITKYNKPSMNPISSPSNKFEEINIDIVGPLPKSGKFSYLLTVIDRFSLYPEAIPLERATTTAVIDALMLNIFARYGVPGRLISDRGAIFLAHEFRETMRILGIEHQYTTSFNPQANGLVERHHRFLKSSIRAALLAGETAQWEKVLGMVLLSIRNSYLERIKTCPSQILYGHSMRLPGDLIQSPENILQEPSIYAQNLRKELLKIRPGGATFKAKLGYVDPRLRTCKWVFVKNMQRKNKLMPNYSGPYRVINKNEKYFTLQFERKEDNVALHRLKPAYMMPCENPIAKFEEQNMHTSNRNDQSIQLQQNVSNNSPRQQKIDHHGNQDRIDHYDNQSQDRPDRSVLESPQLDEHELSPSRSSVVNIPQTENITGNPQAQNVNNNSQIKRQIQWRPNTEALRESFKQNKNSNMLKRIRNFNEKGKKESTPTTRLRSGRQ